jgi:hypothetical protein
LARCLGWRHDCVGCLAGISIAQPIDTQLIFPTTEPYRHDHFERLLRQPH